MPADLANHLASKYLVADPETSSKKRKRKSAPTHAGLIISEDDDWGSIPSVAADENVEHLPQILPGTTAEFRKCRRNNWKTLESNDAACVDETAAAANTILASAVAERNARLNINDELPVVESVSHVVEMSDGTHAGLQTASAVSAQLEKRSREEKARFQLQSLSAKEKETVYRDATGRRVDLSMKRAEARRVAAEAEKMYREAKQALKGEVQLEEARQRSELLQDAKFLPFARTADDENFNKELKEQNRWNDPLLQFGGDYQHNSGKVKQGSVKKPSFPGAAPPNRYGIKPGNRWDGVDRGVGFETERFKAMNRRDRLKNQNYAWQMDE